VGSSSAGIPTAQQHVLGGEVAVVATAIYAILGIHGDFTIGIQGA